MTAPVRVGIVGLGGWARGTRKTSRSACPARRSSRRAARSPKSASGRARRLPALALYEDYAHCSRDKDVDAVLLVTPTSLHPQQIIAALRAGKHVFCEKPLSLELDECLARRGRGRAASAPQGDDRLRAPLRSELSRRATTKIAAGAIGRPFLVRSQTCRQERSRRLLRAVRADVRRHLPRLQRARHRPRALAARQPEAEARVRDRHGRGPRRPARMRRRRQRRCASANSPDGSSPVLRVAHDGARPRDARPRSSAPPAG